MKRKDSNSSSSKLYKNLTILLKIFKNRPNHLSKYLIENNAFNKEFVKKILDSDKLNKFSEDPNNQLNFDSILEEEYFTTFEEVDSFCIDILEKSSSKDLKEIEDEWNLKLITHLQNEEYEQAAKVRDYMVRNKIKII